jgi:hypothetical protein
MTEPTDHESALRRFATEAAILEVVDGVLNGTWPVSQWHHHEHCIATAGLLLFRKELDLERELPGIIQRYNVAQGGRNTDTEGYHHTITLLYLRAIKDFMSRIPAGTSAVEICRQLLKSPLGHKDYPLRYYSKDVLFSVTARRAWLAPDLAKPAYL